MNFNGPFNNNWERFESVQFKTLKMDVIVKCVYNDRERIIYKRQTRRQSQAGEIEWI
jgi:hypothetical protein